MAAIGTIVTAHRPVSVETQAGCLTLDVGTLLVVMYVGVQGDEEGWLFCQDVTSAEQHWVPEDAVVPPRAEDPSAQFEPGIQVRARMKVVGGAEGYLSLDVGQILTVRYVGSKQKGDAGWLYGIMECSEGFAKGWLPAGALEALPRPPPTPLASHGGYNNQSGTGAIFSQKDSGKRGSAQPHPPPQSSQSRPCDDAVSMAANLRPSLQLAAASAPPTMLWEYPLCDRFKRSFVGYLPGALTSQQAGTFLRKIMDNVDWENPEGRMGRLSRSTAWMVSGNCRCPYRYGGVEVDPTQFPQWMYELMEVVMPLCGLKDPRTWPNSCNLNRYADGSDAISWHSDNEQLFRGQWQDCCIISLSLGQERRFEVRSIDAEDGDGSEVIQIQLRSGDICTMEGSTQRHYVHRVPKGGKSMRLRVNLTWRWIVAHHTRYCSVKCDGRPVSAFTPNAY
eukprot:gnl/MRDRNA2_/MRDRNA2_77326_c0_seq3.p1 gnl/MRDRNA2_/MRDRNA2_77326_c0~~gnl/MRDRNA2_/MRDRNA2_77326_c0_seq3.p1  ORF type:complete len:448 (-),score=61.46 gnl/MRDRNA2_/MRDRNA2_77326_c0_seq3:7-1350(-)